MRELEKVTIALTPEMAKEVADSINGGEFTTAGEAIRDAMRLWIEERKMKEQRRKIIAEQSEMSSKNWLLDRLRAKD